MDRRIPDTRSAKVVDQFIPEGCPTEPRLDQDFLGSIAMPSGDRYDCGMELRQLRYFVAVAKERNFTGAARGLRIAQPALSRQIRQLEDELGVRLFERLPRGVRLTEGGAAFLGEAEALLAQSAQAIRTAQNRGAALTQPLRVGYVWGLFHSLVPAWITRHRRDHPEAREDLLDLTATEQAEALTQGTLDLGFIGLAYEADAARLEKRRVATCAWMAVLPERHPAARQRQVRLATLARDLFLAISDVTYPGAAQILYAACQRAGFRPRVLQSAERGYTLLGMVAAECGLTLLPESLRDLPHPGVVFRPLVDPPTFDLHVAWSRRHRSPARDAFLARLEREEVATPVSPSSGIFPKLRLANPAR